MSIRVESTFKRILCRIPLRLSIKLIFVLSLIGLNPIRMKLLRVILKWAGVKMNGKPKYISTSVFWDNFDQVTLGDKVVISSNVSLLTHDYSLTTALIAAGEEPDTDMAIIRPIKIGNNVFVGRGAILMPGTIIEDNVIVGTGSVVRGKIESNSVVIGNPAEKICSIQEIYEKHKSKFDDMQILKD